MALSLEPKLLIADEPTTALDVTIQAQVLELLRQLTSEFGTSVVLITHDLGVVAGMTQRINVMYAGYFVETGPTAEIFAHPTHPYTVGLLHSIPRLDAEDEELIPIEGVPPDLRSEPIGCPFAPRCAWRIERCWDTNPALERVDDSRGRTSASAPDAGHRVACHNRPTAEEAAAGRPLRDGFTAAPPPQERVAALVAAAPEREEELVSFDPGERE